MHSQLQNTHCPVCTAPFLSGEPVFHTVTKDGVTRTAYHTSCFHLRQDIECLLDEVERCGDELAAQQIGHTRG